MLNVYDDLTARAEAKGLDLIEVAESVGIARSTLWRWRTGKFKPQYDKLTSLVEAIDGTGRAGAA